MLNGLTQLNIELTSRCDKKTLCGMCGHQDASVNPGLRFGDMSAACMVALAKELSPLGRSLVVQFHRDGDPLAFDHLHEALQIFAPHLRSIVTHGERLVAQAQALIGHCESVCVSVFRGDPDREIQLAALRGFLDIKGDRLPRVLVKVVGDMREDELAPLTELGVPLLWRRLHTPEANTKYAHGAPTMPEHGLCLDLLHHPSVAWDGRVYLCNRLDTRDAGVIGDLHTQTFDQIWNGPIRASAVQAHLDGRRQDVPPCRDCRYYGVPAS